MSSKTQTFVSEQEYEQVSKISKFQIWHQFLALKIRLLYVYAMLIVHEYEQNVSMSEHQTTMSMSEYEF